MKKMRTQPVSSSLSSSSLDIQVSNGIISSFSTPLPGPFHAGQSSEKTVLFTFLLPCESRIEMFGMRERFVGAH
jgi:hypothetical protein